MTGKGGSGRGGRSESLPPRLGRLVFSAGFAVWLGTGAAQGAGPAPGTVPTSIRYQGRFERAGYPVTGSILAAFRVYDSAAAGSLLWDSGPQSVAAVQGLFGVDLAVTDAALTVPGPKYLEVEAEGRILGPRQPLGAAPYARIAKTLEDQTLPATAVAVGGSRDLSFWVGSPGFVKADRLDPSGPFVVLGSSVGIGTTLPQALLEVAGRIQLTGAGSKLIFPDGSSIDTRIPPKMGALSHTGDVNVTADMDGNATGDIVFQTGPNTRFTLENAGTGHVTGNLRVDGGLAAGGAGASPRSRVIVQGGAIEPRSGLGSNRGIQFPLDPAGGSGDFARLRFGIQSGDDTQFRIETGNDYHDAISFQQAGKQVLNIFNGKVGIDTAVPGTVGGPSWTSRGIRGPNRDPTSRPRPPPTTTPCSSSFPGPTTTSP